MNSWMKAVTVAISIALCLALLNGIGFAAKPPVAGGTLSGKVTDKNTGKAIAGAVVTAYNSSGSYSGTTGTRGTYSISLPAGAYTVKCEAAGYTAALAYGVTIRDGIITTMNFALIKSTVITGTLTGKVTDSVSGAAIAGAAVKTDAGGYSAITDSTGTYTLTNIAAGAYNVTAVASGYNPLTKPATISAGAITTLDFALVRESAAITSLTATPDSFVEATALSVSLSATISSAVIDYQWSQVNGPRVPLTSVDATSASADVSVLAVAAEAELVFRLTVTGSDGLASSRDVTVLVQPADMLPFLGANVQIGGASTVSAKFTVNGANWALFNVGNQLKATPIGIVKGAVYTLVLPGMIFDIDVISYNGATYALVADGSAGVAVVNITNPAAMALVSVTPVNFYQAGITFTDTGGTIWYDNVISGAAGPVVALETDGTNVYLADFAYGIHKTAITNIFGAAGPVLEADGTLKIDQEVYTLQYAGENPWGGPISLKLFNGKLFAGLNSLGMALFDTALMQQVGRYNLYTDEARLEDYFGPMAITQVVGKDAAGDLYLDDFTGMPDYRQVQYEVLVIMKGTGSGATPWADFERTGKWYYKAQDIDVVQQGARAIAYIAYSLGGVVAVDVTGYASATPANFLNAPYLGYFPAVPVNGPYDTNSLPSSILPYEGAGMLKESGVTGVRVSGDKAYLTEHFAGLVIVDKAATPDIDWHGLTPPYNNDTNGIANDNVPDYEDITSYDMSPWDPLDNESLPWAFYQAPCQLATKELNGHGYSLTLMDTLQLTTAGNVDVLECSSAGGFVFVDVTNILAPVMTDRFSIVAYFPTTDEVGAAADGTATQTIAIGHASGIDASAKYLYVSDGPHGVSAWNIVDALGYPTDFVHLVANTLQDEYPVAIGTEIIYPASHTVRNVIDLGRGTTWAQCVSNGMRGVPVSEVEAGLGQVGAPLLLKLQRNDLFEHNAEEFSLKALPYQDKAYDVEFRGNYAYVADGSNGITIYDVTKDPSLATSGFFVSNIGANLGDPLLGTASGIELWTDPATSKTYAFVAAGPYGVGVVDITDINAMKLVKVFEPIKIEDDDIGVADGQAIDVEVVGDKAYFSYDSFGVVCYTLADLIAPLPEGVDPTDIFLKNLSGTVIYDYRPVAAGRFKLQLVPGYENVDGGAVRMDYTVQSGKLFLYVAFAEAGLIKIDFTDPANPVLVDRKDTSAGASDVVISNGRVYVADGSGGLVFFK